MYICMFDYIYMYFTYIYICHLHNIYTDINNISNIHIYIYIKYSQHVFKFHAFCNMNILPLFFTISSMWKFLRCTSKLLEAASRKLNAQRFDNPTSVTWARWPFLEMFIGIYTHNHPGGTIPVYLPT